jgi:hypothetical protein
MMYEDAKELSRASFLQKYGGSYEWLYDKVHGELIRQILKESIEAIRKRKEKESLMSKVKDWLIEMEEDAAHLTLTEWTLKHGSNHQDIWHRIQGETEDQFEMEL